MTISLRIGQTEANCLNTLDPKSVTLKRNSETNLKKTLSDDSWIKWTSAKLPTRKISIWERLLLWIDLILLSLTSLPSEWPRIMSWIFLLLLSIVKRFSNTIKIIRTLLWRQQFIYQQFSSKERNQSVEKPAVNPPLITTERNNKGQTSSRYEQGNHSSALFSKN